jgi:hypothetical protein
MVDGPNTYGFCGGDPVNRSDPMGTDWEVFIAGKPVGKSFATEQEANDYRYWVMNLIKDKFPEYKGEVGVYYNSGVRPRREFSSPFGALNSHPGPVTDYSAYGISMLHEGSKDLGYVVNPNVVTADHVYVTVVAGIPAAYEAGSYVCVKVVKYATPKVVALVTGAGEMARRYGGQALQYGQNAWARANMAYTNASQWVNGLLDRTPGLEPALELKGANPRGFTAWAGSKAPMGQTATQKSFNDNYDPDINANTLIWLDKSHPGLGVLHPYQDGLLKNPSRNQQLFHSIEAANEIPSLVLDQVVCGIRI